MRTNNSQAVILSDWDIFGEKKLLSNIFDIIAKKYYYKA